VRVVWCQDTGDGSDVFAEGRQCRLMGFDTERGERPILAALSNYSRPMFTPRGDRIIFSDRGQHRVYVVHWDGTGLRPLLEGFALDTWLDPADGAEWVYFASEPQDVPRRDLRAYAAVMRARIAEPDKREPVWNARDVTRLAENNFQISSDGRRASLHDPAGAGLVDLVSQTWQPYGKGCWPSVAPGEEDLFWFFDGGHRSLSVFSPGLQNRRQVVINTAPGINGREVFHPRWSNDPRVMAMTGPLTPDKREVEVHLGRFNPTHTAVEQWVQVTANRLADYFPDVWVATVREGGGTRAAAEPPRRAPTAPPWPSSREGLAFLWENRSRNNEIRDPFGSNQVCRVEPRDLARYGRNLDMDLTGGAFVAETGAAALLAGCRRSGQVAIEMLVTPRLAAASADARIVSFSEGSNRCNFALSQEGNRLVFRLCTAQGADRTAAAVTVGELQPDVPQHVVVSYRSGLLACWVNGREASATPGVSGGLEGWIPARLTFGDEWQRGHGWAGALEGIALYSRWVSAEEAARNHALYAQRLHGRTTPPRLVVEARARRLSTLPTVKAISPYRRALVANRYDVVRVAEGAYEGREIMVAHWAILDGRCLEAAARESAKLYRMTVEPFAARPDLEGERLVTDDDEFSLEMYYDVGS
jgi:hypothetical protein